MKAYLIITYPSLTVFSLKYVRNVPVSGYFVYKLSKMIEKTIYKGLILNMYDVSNNTQASMVMYQFRQVRVLLYGKYAVEIDSQFWSHKLGE